MGSVSHWIQYKTSVNYRAKFTKEKITHNVGFEFESDKDLEEAKGAEI